MSLLQPARAALAACFATLLATACQPDSAKAPAMMETPKDPSIQQQAKGFDETADQLASEAEKAQNAAESPLQLADEVVATLQAENKDVSKEHRVTFNIAFPTEASARQAAERFTQSGFTCTVRPRPMNQWQVEATVSTAPASLTFRKATTALTAQVEELEGEIHAWRVTNTTRGGQ